MANDKEKKNKQNPEPDNAELQHKISDKQSPADTDKVGESGKDQKSNRSPVGGAVERERETKKNR